MRSILLGASLLLASLCTVARAQDLPQSISVNGLSRSFLLHVPSGAAPAGGYPLVLAFHGGGGNAARMAQMSGFDALADQRRFIVIYPNGVDRHWNDGRATIKNPQDDVDFVRALLKQVEQAYPVDHQRVFAAGISNGALFAERLGCQLADQFTAIAPVSGTMPADIASSCHPSRPLAVMLISGNADPIMPFKGGDVATFGNAGEGGAVLSFVDTARLWAQQNHCAFPARLQPEPVRVASDPTRIVRASYAACAAPVVALTVLGGGHTWPGGAQYAPKMIVGTVTHQLDASPAIIDFFLYSATHG